MWEDGEDEEKLRIYVVRFSPVSPVSPHFLIFLCFPLLPAPLRFLPCLPCLPCPPSFIYPCLIVELSGRLCLQLVEKEQSQLQLAASP